MNHLKSCPVCLSSGPYHPYTKKKLLRCTRPKDKHVTNSSVLFIDKKLKATIITAYIVFR